MGEKGTSSKRASEKAGRLSKRMGGMSPNSGGRMRSAHATKSSREAPSRSKRARRRRSPSCTQRAKAVSIEDGATGRPSGESTKRADPKSKGAVLAWEALHRPLKGRAAQVGAC